MLTLILGFKSISPTEETCSSPPSAAVLQVRLYGYSNHQTSVRLALYHFILSVVFCLIYKAKDVDVDSVTI